MHSPVLEEELKENAPSDTDVVYLFVKGDEAAWSNILKILNQTDHCDENFTVDFLEILDTMQVAATYKIRRVEKLLLGKAL